MQCYADDHIVAANEGNAVGLAIGDYLATSRPGVVYMQNSGLGNVINPLTSLADRDVYGIPMILVIGWRGEPGRHDEPQHIKQGEITLGQLNILGVPYVILDENSSLDVIKALYSKMIIRNGPVAIVVKKGALASNWKINSRSQLSTLKRELAIEMIVSALPNSSFFVATTGKAGRELYEIREKSNQPQRDFLTVGGMGHASSIALGIARHYTKNWVVCLDGDGAALMHMGAMAIISSQKPSRFLHVILNNAAHESVGGQPTIADGIDFELLADSLKYDGYLFANNPFSLAKALSDLEEKQGIWLLEVHLALGARADLGRPKSSPEQNKQSVMSYLSQNEE